MAQAVVIFSVISPAVSISLAIISVLFLSRIRDEENNFKMQLESLQKQFVNFKVDTSSEFAFHREYLRVVVALNSSLQMVEDKVGGMRTELRALQSVCGRLATLNSSLETTQGLTSNTDRDLNTSNTVVQGIIVAGLDGVFTISLTSLQQTKISNGSANHIAFDWNSRKVYWTEVGVKGTKKGNLDGTDVENLVVGGRSMRLLAVDSITGNIYYRNVSQSHQDVVVCNRNEENCSIVATNPYEIYSFALYPSKSLMFWTNRNSVMKANMDGTNPRVILSESIPSLAVDATSERLYWISKQKTILSIAVGNRPVIKYDPWRYIASCDLNGIDRRVLWNTTRGLDSMEISGDVVYFSNGQGILSGSKNEGNLSFITKMATPIYSMALYGSKGHVRENPCVRSPCSHLCVLKLESFACLCPQGKKLDQDGTTCV